MKKLEQWFWDYGVRRGYDESDPDHEMRKISIGHWLDPALQSLDRINAINKNDASRGCIALWGPSQTGKSTLLSSYIDGDQPDGTDSALTWRKEAPVRFSPTLNNDVPEGTLIFNPYNYSSDASGVATRYTLSGGDQTDVDPLYPVSMRLATRAQIIHALSLGYFSECAPVGDSIDVTQDAFLEKIEASTDAIHAPDKNAYSLLKDCADVISFMRNHHRFYHLFRRGDWERKIRPALVSADAFVKNQTAAKEFLADLFWDGSREISSLFDEIMALRERLMNLWGERKIVLTQEAASLLLDIDTYRNFVTPHGDNGQLIADKVANLAWKIDNDVVHVFVGAGRTEIGGDNFGAFQALCGELNVPLRAAALEGERKRPFRDLIEKCDILDLPGLSNLNTGGMAGAETSSRIDVTKAEKTILLTRVFKEGKTQSFVYGYVRGYGVDAFVILVRSDRPPSKSDLLNAGITEWLRAYEADWKHGSETEMPVFIDMTFFGKVLNDVSMNGVGNGLLPIVDRIQSQLIFANKCSSKWFTTNYAQFPDGAITAPGKKDAVIGAIAADPSFIPSTGINEQGLRSVYDEDGGVGFMLKTISDGFDCNRRSDKCREILKSDAKVLVGLIKRQLPSDSDNDDAERRGALERIVAQLSQCVSKCTDRREGQEMLATTHVLKKVFSATPDMFDPVPMAFSDGTDEQQREYVGRQVSKWFSSQVANIPSSSDLTAEDLTMLLAVLRDSVDVNACVEFLSQGGLGRIADSRTAASARYPLALLMGNLLRYGRPTAQGEDLPGERQPSRLEPMLATSKRDYNLSNSPYCISIIDPVCHRINALMQNGLGGGRPPQIGDKELAEILAEIA